ncbi:GNAT family N-acetyltransferase [Flavobacterium oreochromis]|uniref:hypothetical protein n=1 Tax=Flavobacterium oreochromis TaxID=2906078 RepID=UPI001F23D2B2|nr:hypothetical protein [Flavobacterium oreochromis]
MNLQPQLENDTILLLPLEEEDFDALYFIASDPLIWEQHPQSNRYKIEIFKLFFKEALNLKERLK